MSLAAYRRLSAVLVALCSLFTHHAQAGPRYVIEPLASVPNQVDVAALGINNAAQVVGYIRNSDGNAHAVRWNAGQAELLPELAADEPFSQAFRINDAGQIVGKARAESGFLHATLWDATGVVDLGTPSGAGETFATDINQQGVVVGSAVSGTGSSTAFSWTSRGGFVEFLGQDPPGRFGNAGFNGVNNNGLMVGTTFHLLEPFRAAFAREGDRVLTDLSPPGRTLGMVLAVNDAGTMVGYQGIDFGNPQATIFHEDGTLEPLGTLGLEESWAQDINEAGVIVGRAFSFDLGGVLIPKALIYQNGVASDLLDLIDNGSDWTLIEAAGINDHGLIVGSGVLNGEVRAFLARPVPEPTTAFLGLCTVLGIVTLRRVQRNA